MADMNQKTFLLSMRDAGESATSLTGTAISSMAHCRGTPHGASFAEAPGFAAVSCHDEPNRAYEGGGIENAAAPVYATGYAALACCDAIVSRDFTTLAPATQEAEPAMQWLTLFSAG